ncbi:DUF4245 domain-containing protein [Gryllotalpicola sp.]|uniref:DUF4245 domain-containing protein n=1 Tax=Gryllotalpicola sp. TaxID=1932787 RepID=UPI002628D509|nr:DUF4245 domain-containing protein [Gryllotalpicola sp.]
MADRPIVAELGRPETPAEEAARRAESSRLHRDRQTFSNLVYALIATLAVVAVIVLIVPRPTSPQTPAIDWHQLVQQAGAVESVPLADPVLPTGWSANAATFSPASTTPGAPATGVDVWHLGFITPDQKYVSVDQGFHADDTWVADTLDDVIATGTATIGGAQWVVYDNRDGQTPGKRTSYGLVYQGLGSTLVISGTAAPAQMTTVIDGIQGTLRGLGSK